VQMILGGIPHNYTEQLAHGRHGAGPGYLRRAEEFMRAHAASPLCLDQIAAAAGCSVRTLSLVFRRFRETTPLAALHKVRLEAVRAELLDRTNSAPTFEIALRYGFSNKGRFKRAYQQRFGQAPPVRLRRSAKP
jgi:transcriptional regulator GlxA family with amidase domain